MTNRGIDRTAANIYWKRVVARHGALEITLEGDAEFYAEKVHFEGPLQFHVPQGERWVASMRDGQVDVAKGAVEGAFVGIQLWGGGQNTLNRMNGKIQDKDKTG